MFVVRLIRGRESEFLVETKTSFVPTPDHTRASVFPSIADGLDALRNYLGGDSFGLSAAAVERVRFKKEKA